MQSGGAAFHVAACEGVAVALLQIDADGAGDGAAAGCGAVDVQADEGAGIHPVGDGGMRDLVTDGVDGDLKTAEVVVVERAAGVVAGAVEDEAGLILVAEEVEAFEIELLGAIGDEALRGGAGRSRGVDDGVIEMETGCVGGVGGVADLDHGGGAGIGEGGAAGAAACAGAAAQSAAAKRDIAGSRGDDDLVCSRDGRAGQQHRGVVGGDAHSRAHGLGAQEVARVAGAAVGGVERAEARLKFCAKVRAGELIDCVGGSEPAVEDEWRVSAGAAGQATAAGSDLCFMRLRSGRVPHGVAAVAFEQIAAEEGVILAGDEVDGGSGVPRSGDVDACGGGAGAAYAARCDGDCADGAVRVDGGRDCGRAGAAEGERQRCAVRIEAEAVIGTDSYAGDRAACGNDNEMRLHGVPGGQHDGVAEGPA
jgi:hypothetical protein